MKKALGKYGQLYLMFIPVLIWYLLFCYEPMSNFTIAFKKFSVIRGIKGSPWVGMANFQQMFEAPMFWRAFRNTLIISAQNLLFGFPAPILFALLLNELTAPRFKKAVQTISYLPHFISWSVAGGLVYMLLSPDTGALNHLLVMLGGTGKNYLAISSYFHRIVLFSHMWKSLGWGSIVFLAAITGVDDQLHEAARIDGANRFQRIWYITLPGMINMIAIQFVLRVGAVMEGGFDQVFNLYTAPVYETGDIIDTYIYRLSFVKSTGINLGFTTAVGLFKNVINFILLMLANGVTKALGQETVL